MEQFGGLVGDHGGDGGVTRSGLKYWLLSPTSSVVEEDEIIVITSLPYYRLVLWPHWFGIWTRVLGPWRAPDVTRVQWAPSSWRTSFRSLILGAICRCYGMPYCSHPSWHGRDCFSTSKVLQWMIIMSFEKIMLLRLKSGGSIGLHPMYLLLTVVLLVVVLLHRLFLVWAHRLFPHLHLTVATLALARDQDKGVASVRAYK